MSPLVNRVVASLVGEERLVDHVSIYAGNVGMERGLISVKRLLQLVLHGLRGSNFHKEVDEVASLLRKRLLLEIASEGLIIFFVSILLILTILSPNAHFVLHLNPPVEDEDIEVEHLLQEKAVVPVHHGMRVRHTIILTVVGHIVGRVHPVE